MAIHPTAIIDPKAELDASVEVGPYCVIDAHVRIAAHCRLYHGVYVTGHTDIQEGCELHPGVIVGHAPQDTKYHGERSFCRIGRQVILREHVTVHRGTIPDSATEIGDRCFLLAGSHVGHNCRIGQGVTLINNVLLGGHVEIGERANLGGAAGVHQFVRIGELVMVAGIARVIQDIVPFALVGPDGRIAGVNRIGLRRAGWTHAQVHEIREAYRVLFQQRGNHAAAVERLAALVRTAAGERLLEFVRAASRHGLAGRCRGRGAPPVEEKP